LRSFAWVKIKAVENEEFVIGGFTKPKGSRDKFGSLILGRFENKVLQFVGHVGTGFDRRLVEEVFEKMQPLVIDKCPFEKKPATNGVATWISPKLVAEISFAEWTKAGRLRQP